MVIDETIHIDEFITMTVRNENKLLATSNLILFNSLYPSTFIFRNTLKMTSKQLLRMG